MLHPQLDAGWTLEVMSTTTARGRRPFFVSCQSADPAAASSQSAMIRHFKTALLESRRWTIALFGIEGS